MSRYQVTPVPQLVRVVPAWYLSVTIDTSLLIGGRWWGPSRGLSEGLSRDRVPPLDLNHADLAQWASALSPALVRVGGTEADRIRYGFKNDGEVPPDFDPEAFVLKGKLWKKLNEWALAQGFEVVFTVSAGPESRDAAGRWDPSGAERLLRNTARKGYPVVAWEFGNEVNAYPFLYGPGGTVRSRRYQQDFEVFAALVRKWAPTARTVGPSSAIWPLIGEPNPLIPSFTKSSAAAQLDVLSFHYYPQQSSRGRVAVRRAKPGTLLSARILDGTNRWLRYGRRCLDRGPAAGAPLWITETGHALYGGEPGLSDTWQSTPWWLDQLGLMAQQAEVVFRQALVGGDYGLLEEKTFRPRPDYFASLLWKRHMGPFVYKPPQVTGPNRRLRAWHHGWPDGRQCLLLVNLSQKRPAQVTFEGQATSYRLLQPLGGQRSRLAVLDGSPLVGPDVLDLIASPGLPLRGPLHLPPLACAFVEWKN